MLSTFWRTCCAWFYYYDQLPICSSVRMACGRRQPSQLVNLHIFGRVASLANTLPKWSPYATDVQSKTIYWGRVFRIYLLCSRYLKTCASIFYCFLICKWHCYIFQTHEKITSIHSDHIAEVYEMPMKYIIRPIPSELDEEKVKSLIETLQVQNYSYCIRFDTDWRCVEKHETSFPVQ